MASNRKLKASKLYKDRFERYIELFEIFGWLVPCPTELCMLQVRPERILICICVFKCINYIFALTKNCEVRKKILKSMVMKNILIFNNKRLFIVRQPNTKIIKLKWMSNIYMDPVYSSCRTFILPFRQMEVFEFCIVSSGKEFCSKSYKRS